MIQLETERLYLEYIWASTFHTLSVRMCELVRHEQAHI